jgi:hypothetical protein
MAERSGNQLLYHYAWIYPCSLKCNQSRYLFKCTYVDHDGVAQFTIWCSVHISSTVKAQTPLWTIHPAGNELKQLCLTLKNIRASRVAQWSKATRDSGFESRLCRSRPRPGWLMWRRTIGPASSGLGRVWPAEIPLSRVASRAQCTLTRSPGVRCFLRDIGAAGFLVGWALCQEAVQLGWVVFRRTHGFRPWLGCVSEDAWLPTLKNISIVKSTSKLAPVSPTAITDWARILVCLGCPQAQNRTLCLGCPQVQNRTLCLGCPQAQNRTLCLGCPQVQNRTLRLGCPQVQNRTLCLGCPQVQNRTLCLGCPQAQNRTLCLGSWRFELLNVSLDNLMTWRSSAKRSGTKSLLRCV